MVRHQAAFFRAGMRNPAGSEALVQGSRCQSSSALCEMEALAFHRHTLREELRDGRLKLGQSLLEYLPRLSSPALPSGAFFYGSGRSVFL